MTRTEFILRAMLQMAANPKYVTIEKSEDEPDVTFPCLQDEAIYIDAEALANEAEKRMESPFNEQTDGEYIADKLGDIEEEMEREFDIEHDIK